MSASQESILDHAQEELRALARVARTLASPLELPDLLTAAMQTVARVIRQADVGAIMLCDEPSNVIRPVAAFGCNLDALKEIGLRPGESVCGKVYQSGSPLLLASQDEVLEAMTDLSPFNREILQRSMGHEQLSNSILAVPIVAGVERVGVFLLESFKGHEPFTDEVLPFVQALADLIALAIDRERRLTRVEAVRDSLHADRFRLDVMATASHELRMLLATIKGYATALQMDEIAWAEAKRQEFLRLIEEACNDMEAMIRDILDTDQIDIDRLQLEHQPLQLDALAREMAAEVECRSPRHHPLVDFPGDFPQVQADHRRIKQVFRNILDNAVKYSPEGGLIVIQGEARKADVVVSISDQGIGIPSENLIQLFDASYRVRRSSKLHIPGTGLGLPIARAIIEAHDGRIWVESREGEGTTIFFSMPCSAREATARL
jgi:K+-sensing histidine kinase KdpD